ncbi:hypothetical protein BRC91_10420 [Halobacteriales archaeon QS_4_62_28]|nr:MAG: hypothetical protein BRC91_10420 [Halobacteriales archaeon QS_4_62_28]
MSDEATVKATLRALAGETNGETRDSSIPDSGYRETIERATTALDDLDAAAAFVEDGGIDELKAAVEAAEQSVSASASDGLETLEAYRTFRAAAADDHFHRGRGTSLGDGDKADTK